MNNIKFFAVLLAFLTFLPLVSHSAIYRTNSTIVVDAQDNDVIYEDNANSLAYPASITKVMTMLILFDQLEAGKLTLDSFLTVSNRAARQPKTRLGMRAGDSISVDLAIRALVVISANDVAVVIAENIAGSIPKFAQLMNQKAKQIGMTKTQFVNPSGLPHSRQVTTARDLALMGLYVLQNYPQYYHYFSVEEFNYGGRVIKTHNKVLSYNQGVDGFKTGYVRRSGYNLLTSAERNGRRVVAVVLGGGTSSSRDNTMAFLLNRYLPKADTYDNRFVLNRLKTANRTAQQPWHLAYKKGKGKQNNNYVQIRLPKKTPIQMRVEQRLAELELEKQRQAEFNPNLLLAGKRPTDSIVNENKKQENDL